MDLFTIIGLGGVGFYVGSYALVQVGKMDGNGALYSAMNVVAAALVLVSLFEDFNLPSMVTQISWIGIGFGGMALRARRQLIGSEHAPTVEAAPAGETPRVGEAGPGPAVAEQASSTPSLSLALAGSGTGRVRPPIDRFANTRSTNRMANTFERVRPVGAPVKPKPQPNFNLQPDAAPVARVGRTRLGLQPDLAPMDERSAAGAASR